MTISKTVPVSPMTRHPEIEAPSKEDLNDVTVKSEETELTTMPSVGTNETLHSNNNETLANLNATALDHAETSGSTVANSTAASKEDAEEAFGMEGSPLLMAVDDAYPNPEELGQARDEYWASRAVAARSRSAPYLSVVSVPYGQPAYRASRLPEQHQPLYIPLNPADRQSRQLPAQLYASSRPAAKKLFPEASA